MRFGYVYRLVFGVFLVFVATAVTAQGETAFIRDNSQTLATIR